MLHRAWELRQESTVAEARLWLYLRTLREQGIHFRRQHAIGPYVADFCAVRQRLVIELDGSPHRGDHNADQTRTEYLQSEGYKVLRFWNDQVNRSLQTVIRQIEKALKDR